MHRDAVRPEAVQRLGDGRRDEDLDRPRAGGAPAALALDGRAPEQDAPEDPVLRTNTEVVLPGCELAAGVDAALARGRRRLVVVPRAARVNRLVDRPRIAVEDAAQEGALDPPHLPPDGGPQRVR